jgi:hypothetical protein
VCSSFCHRRLRRARTLICWSLELFAFRIATNLRLVSSFVKWPGRALPTTYAFSGLRTCQLEHMCALFGSSVKTDPDSETNEADRFHSQWSRPRAEPCTRRRRGPGEISTFRVLSAFVRERRAQTKHRYWSPSVTGRRTILEHAVAPRGHPEIWVSSCSSTSSAYPDPAW